MRTWTLIFVVALLALPAQAHGPTSPPVRDACFEFTITSNASPGSADLAFEPAAIASSGSYTAIKWIDQTGQKAPVIFPASADGPIVQKFVDTTKDARFQMRYGIEGSQDPTLISVDYSIGFKISPGTTAVAGDVAVFTVMFDANCDPFYQGGDPHRGIGGVSYTPYPIPNDQGTPLPVTTPGAPNVPGGYVASGHAMFDIWDFGCFSIGSVASAPARNGTPTHDWYTLSMHVRQVSTADKPCM